MAIIARKPESQFSPCPEGLHQAVCVDVVDLGVLQTIWGDKHKVRIVWQIEEENEHGTRFDIRKQYNLSLHEKATLRKDLEAWRGRKFSEEELKGFDLEKLLDVNCQVQVIHDISDEGKIYANVQAVVPAYKGVVKLAAQDYVRQKDRPSEHGNGHSLGKSELGEEDPDFVPF